MVTSNQPHLAWIKEHGIITLHTLHPSRDSPPIRTDHTSPAAWDLRRDQDLFSDLFEESPSLHSGDPEDVKACLPACIRKLLLLLLHKLPMASCSSFKGGILMNHLCGGYTVQFHGVRWRYWKCKDDLIFNLYYEFQALR